MRKILFSTMGLFFILLSSCGNNDGIEEMDNPTTQISRKLSRITTKNGTDIFIYDNNKISKAFFRGCSGMLYEFNYGSNGKVSEYYYGTGFSETDLSNSNISKLNTKVILEYSSNNRLSKKVEYSKDNQGQFTDIRGEEVYDYDSEGRLFKVNYIGGSISYISFDSNGNPTANDEGTTYIYDDKINPFYEIFAKVGVLGIETCNSFDSGGKLDTYISKNNATDIKRNGNLSFSGIYTYDSDGYPIKCNYTSSSGSNSEDVFVYD